MLLKQQELHGSVWRRTEQIKMKRSANFKISWLGSISFHIFIFFVISFLGIVTLHHKQENIIEVELIGNSRNGNHGNVNQGNNTINDSAPKLLKAVSVDSIMQQVETAEKIYAQSTEVKSNGTSTTTGESGGGDGSNEARSTEGNHGEGGAGERTVVAVGPTVTRSVEPNFPDSARDNNQEANFTVRLTIDDKGNVVNVDILSANVPNDFVNAAKQALYEWKFTPAKNKLGEAINSTVTIPISFKLED